MIAERRSQAPSGPHEPRRGSTERPRHLGVYGPSESGLHLRGDHRVENVEQSRRQIAILKV